MSRMEAPTTPQLILWRHAEAEELAMPSVVRWTPARRAQDLDRELTRRGRAQAKRIARWLETHLPGNVRVLASPARRCVETARALTKDFTEVAALGPEHDCADLLRAIDWPNLAGTVIVVGHQPTLGRVAAMMMTGREADWSVKKGSVWWFIRRVRGQRAEHVLRAMVTPDMAKD
jgi:phosphohistidine phosphatase